MNPIVEEMLDILSSNPDDVLMHIGMPRRSGRYPWGSGENPYQRTQDFLGRIEELKKQGWSETPKNIMDEFGLTTSQYRMEKAIAKNERRALDVARAKSLRDDGLGASEIGRQMDIPESTVRSLLNDKSEERMNRAQETANFLKERMKEVNGEFIDVGAGAELEFGISKEKLEQALYLLEREGYVVYNNRIEQPTNWGQFTTQKVLCPPGTEYKDIYDPSKIHTVKEYISRDGGETYEKKFNYPESMDSKRMMIRYNEDGGLERDGVVELRRNVADLSLGDSRYSQVRILVDGTHYIKGMAVYSDDMPPGVDVIFNTNKHRGTPMTDVLKKIKDDPDNPFGSAIKDAEQGGQYWYDSKTGKRCKSTDPNAKLGLINKRADEGDWSDWKDSLPSQFLSKQSLTMARKQLGLAKADKQAEFEEICSITNPTIKKHLLQKFSDSCDSAAVHLQAAALPGQKYHVIIPVNSLKDTEIYAPNYENGTKLALIRYPHGGIFEIPILTVNNKHQQANKLLGKDVGDAVGITSKVAEQLSGADFDGDTVMCIPTHDISGKVKITSKDILPGLIGFDTKEAYGPHTYEGRKVKLMTKKGTQTQMGVISNLITDMTLAGADDNELAAAVRHSMVVIDAEKHKLDYKQSEKDNNIAALHKLYQGKATGGAATVISRAKGEKRVDKRRGTPIVNVKGSKDYDPTKPEGSLIYKTAYDKDLYTPKVTTNKKTGLRTYYTTEGGKVTYDPQDKEAAAQHRPVKKVDPDTGGVTYTNKAGTVTYRVEKKTQKTTKMADTDDAYTLVSEYRHPMEIVYADYANSMKAMGNQARLEMLNTGKIEYSREAKAKYSQEVQDLNMKLKTAELNRTKERAAIRKATVDVKAKRDAGQLTETEDVKKASQRAMAKYRDEVGSVSRRDRNIEITDREWEAIQAGAISEGKLIRILNNADIDSLRERATPKTTTSLSETQIARIKAYAASNYTLEEIATKMGKSPSTIANYLKKGVN